METITIQSTDDRYTLRGMLQRVDGDRVLVLLPWEVERGWAQPLDFEVQRRVAEDRQLDIAWVIEDPERRAAARAAGLPVFKSMDDAQAYLDQHLRFPPPKAMPRLERPALPWYAPTPRAPKKLRLTQPPAWLLALEGLVLLVVLGIIVVTYALAVPSATIALHPATLGYSRIVQVSVDIGLDEVDLQRGVVPATRIGDEFEAYAEVVTSGRGYDFTGLATGEVLFTNLLGQDYPVPQGTIVRTSAGSYPVRYQTTSAVTVPPFGQVMAPVEALVEGPSGNVDPYQINFVEGVVGFAVRVTNPRPITGAQSQTVRVVADADRERAWDIAAQQIMAQAYNGLQELAAAEPGRFLPRQTLVIQAAPKTAYTHLVGERTDVLGLALRLLVTGQAVSARDAQAVAYRQLVTQLPEGYSLADARYEIGEAAEEDIGPGQFTFFITAHGQATARIDAEEIRTKVQRMSVEEARELLERDLPLSQPPDITITPAWFPVIPCLPIRTNVEIVVDGTAR